MTYDTALCGKNITNMALCISWTNLHTLFIYLRNTQQRAWMPLTCWSNSISNPCSHIIIILVCLGPDVDRNQTNFALIEFVVFETMLNINHK